ncbi:MAG: hypothetical protein EOO01_16790 [Chitinophagaceae bacterium]|nr:MAG: hypothetical protein EOO01_16790 [Chitinophagaceae bacterium]
MRMLSICRLLLFTVFTTASFSCSEEKEDYVAGDPISDYLPLQVGKYITYRVDSLVANNFNIALETHSYQVKHVVDAQVTDNLGRPSYRIFRFRNNVTATGQWEANGSYFITPLAQQIEVVENNLRVTKLREPMKEGFSWKGNAYLASNPFEPFGYDFSVDNAIGSWDFVYDLFEPTTVINGQTYKDVWTVEQINESKSDPKVYPSDYANKLRSVEKYSKNIGLVYRQFILWEYETSVAINPAYTGFGITMWMIDHN